LLQLPLRKILLNCELEECCYQKYNVCREKDNIKINAYGDTYSPNNCGGAEYPDVSGCPAGYIAMSKCTPHCEALDFYRAITLERRSDLTLTEANDNIRITSSSISDNNVFNVEIESIIDVELSAKLVTSNGEVLSDYSINCNSGNINRSFDLSMLSSGVYFLNIFFGTTHIKTLKFVVL
jgi:hypothetical protein